MVLSFNNEIAVIKKNTKIRYKSKYSIFFGPSNAGIVEANNSRSDGSKIYNRKAVI